MKRMILFSAMVGHVLLANSCLAFESEMRPQGGFSRMCARLSSCLPEMSLAKRAVPVAVVEEVALTGMFFTQASPAIVPIVVVPLSGSIITGTLAYWALKKGAAQKKLLGLVSGHLTTWIGSIVGITNGWSPDATCGLSLVCGLGGIVIAATCTSLCSARSDEPA